MFHHGQQISQSRNGDRGKVVLWCHFAASRALFDHGYRSSVSLLIADQLFVIYPLESCNMFFCMMTCTCHSGNVR